MTQIDCDDPHICRIMVQVEIRKTICTKFSRNLNDNVFRTRIFRQPGNRDLKRYVDEDSLEEVCKQVADLRTLPHFSQNIGHEGGFYTEFALGIEVDTDVVYGIFYYNELEWGRIMLDFL
ncbi:hypothetical protein CPB84DRAFT_312941 [Gymnopilus junonius]|uniref:Uncharacterized protein n=1 Tax=Gymnopilus junonius TaxID=109634 RepID=A0A9P5NCF6_GYMJU|nr:hypothetical protein CPB84DRAFT_312941 [Gymnopilus junonius]